MNNNNERMKRKFENSELMQWIDRPTERDCKLHIYIYILTKSNDNNHPTKFEYENSPWV